ncbi:MAG: nickel pincer cofactor biosynthesis protein LarB [Anaerolineales bacterium]
MDANRLRTLLEEVRAGRVPVLFALEQIQAFSTLVVSDYAQLDIQRAARQGLPEVVFCQGKTPAQVAEIMAHLCKYHDRVLGTRASPEVGAYVLERLPQTQYDSRSRLLRLTHSPLPTPPQNAPYALVLSAGTADLPVAEEAAQTLEFFGAAVQRACDVGVAGLHRLLAQREAIAGAGVIISVAGMEGALASVVGGLAACPVIGVPTSVGYGVSFDGLAALLAMLNSCAAGVTVVNIDNGFGAAMAAWKILRAADGRQTTDNGGRHDERHTS